MGTVLLQSAEAIADAGRDKRRQLTPEEQALLQLKKQMQAQENQDRLKAMPENEKNDAVTLFLERGDGYLFHE